MNTVSMKPQSIYLVQVSSGLSGVHLVSTNMCNKERDLSQHDKEDLLSLKLLAGKSSGSFI